MRPVGGVTLAEALAARWAKYSEDQPRDADGKFGSGGGGVTLPNETRVSRSDAGVANVLRAGGQATVGPDRVGGLLDHIAGQGTATNIAGLSVTGAGNEHLFTPEPVGRARSEMPVVPGGHDGAEKLAEHLGEQGVSSRFEHVDPRTLTATQSQIDGVKVGQMLGTLREGRPAGTLIVSEDGKILDGHHRWAANAAYAVDHPGHTIEVLRAGEPFAALLGHADQFAVSEGIAAREFGKALWRALRRLVRKGDFFTDENGIVHPIRGSFGDDYHERPTGEGDGPKPATEAAAPRAVTKNEDEGYTIPTDHGDIPLLIQPGLDDPQAAERVLTHLAGLSDRYPEVAAHLSDKGGLGVAVIDAAMAKAMFQVGPGRPSPAFRAAASEPHR